MNRRVGRKRTNETEVRPVLDDFNEGATCRTFSLPPPSLTKKKDKNVGSKIENFVEPGIGKLLAVTSIASTAYNVQFHLSINGSLPPLLWSYDYGYA